MIYFVFQQGLLNRVEESSAYFSGSKYNYSIKCIDLLTWLARLNNIM